MNGYFAVQTVAAKECTAVNLDPDTSRPNFHLLVRVPKSSDLNRINFSIDTIDKYILYPSLQAYKILQQHTNCCLLGTTKWSVSQNLICLLTQRLVAVCAETMVIQVINTHNAGVNVDFIVNYVYF